MKKNIGFINLTSSFITWLLEELPKAPPSAGNTKEIRTALQQLSQGVYTSLMVETDGPVQPAATAQVICCGELTIIPSARKVLRLDREISLTPKEFDILYFLARNKGDVFTKEQIYTAVWEKDYLLDDSNIMAFIRKLRKKIEPHPDAPQYIQTIWGIGYKFNDQV